MGRVTFSSTRQDYERYYRSAFQRSRPFRYPLGWGLALGAALIWIDYCACDFVNALTIARNFAIGLVFAFAFYALLLWTMRLRAKQAMATLAHLSHEVEMGWDADGFSVASVYGGTCYPWPLFRRWMADEHSVVLYITSTVPFLLPKRVLTESAAEEIVGSLRAAGVKETPRRLL